MALYRHKNTYFFNFKFDFLMLLIFLFINNQWYRTLDTYSSSTRKQMNQVNPVKFDSNLRADVMSLNRGEMDRLMDGRYSLERVKTDRVSNFVKINLPKLLTEIIWSQVGMHGLDKE